MSKLEQINAFIAIAEENSFAVAAEKLGISTPAISRQLQALENSLNTTLLTRTTRKIELTEVGAQYYESCKNLLAGLSNTEAMIVDSQREARGTLSIMSNRYFALRYLIPHLSAFMTKHPKLQIKLELGERFPNLSKENIDIVFGVSVEGPEQLVRRKVSTTRYILCASPAYLKKWGTPKIPADLSKHRYITHSMRNNNHIITFRANKEMMLKPFLQLNDSQAMRECALLNMGIIKLHDYMVMDALNKHQLIEVLANFSEPKQPIYLYYQPNLYLQPKIRQFIDFYLAKLSHD